MKTAVDTSNSAVASPMAGVVMTPPSEDRQSQSAKRYARLLSAFGLLIACRLWVACFDTWRVLPLSFFLPSV
jgi:hypothetical protein